MDLTALALETSPEYAYQASPPTANELNAVNLKCPKCGFPMELKQRRIDGAKFFGCSQWKNNGCKGSFSYVEGLQKMEKNGGLDESH